MSDTELREAINTVRRGWRGGCTDVRFSGNFLGEMERAVFTLLNAVESTLPKTKMINVWYVESVGCGPGNTGSLFIAVYRTRAEAEESSRYKEEGLFICVRVTGPHQQEIPA